MDSAFNGFIAPPSTPMADDGSLRLDVVEAQAAALTANDVKGAFICGTTGEGVSLSVEERMAVAGRWREVAPRNFRLIVHVGALGLPDVQTLASHAAEIGADAVGTLPPLYFKPETVDILLTWCGAVASAAEPLPVYYYHMPGVTGVELPLSELLAADAARGSILAGAKFTYEDLMDFRLCTEIAGGRYELFFGRDQMLLGALATGAKQAIGSTYNFAVPLYHRMIDAWSRGDTDAARAEQTRSAEMIGIIHRHGGVAAMKAVMALVGVDCGPVRPPLRPLTDEQIDALAADLDAAGFADYCSRKP